MTETMASLELNKFMSGDLPEDQVASSRHPIRIGTILTICLLIGCYFASNFVIEKRKTELLSELQARQEITVAAKAEIVRTWIEETGQRANLIANHPLFRLFAAEINQLQGRDLPKPLASQLPYMQNAITNLVQQNKLLAAYMVGKDGRAYLASSGAPGLTDEQRTLASNHYKLKEVASSPARISGDDLLFDFLVPVFPAQSNSENDDVAGILMMTISGSEQLADILKPSRLSSVGEETHLYQMQGEGYYELTPNKAPFLSSEPSVQINNSVGNFAARSLHNSSEAIYSIGASIPKTDWVLLQGVSEKAALLPLQTYSYAIYGLAGSFFIVVLSVFSGIWLTLRSTNAKAMANQYRDLAYQINAQKRLLGSINNTIDDLIGLTDAAGKYVYANPSLARFVNFPIQSIPGKTDRDLFGDKTFRKLSEMNQKVVDTHQSENAIIEIDTDEGEKILRIEKSRLLDDNGQFMGIVTVAGDITDFMMHQRQKEELGRKTISILVRMMEDNDPYLAGHSQRISELSNNVAKIMNLPGELQQSIATGANLSQVGKISIPSKIRTKEGRLTKAEMEIMQSHVGKAKSLLTEMDIDETVITAVAQMYERQDGSGYPESLQGSEIAVSARILGMADILVARVSPRSYRRAISVEEAMEVFRTNTGKYDADIVTAMDAFLKSEAGQKFKDSILEENKDR